MDDRNREKPVDDFGMTTPNLRLADINTSRLRPAQSPPTKETPLQPARKGRLVPIWVWLVAGGFLFLIMLAVGVGVFIYLSWEPGFTMIVRGAPPGSDVYVDNISRGVTSADGSIRVPGLKPGKRLVRVSREGFADFNTSVTGKDREVSIVAQLVPLETKTTLPATIDYHGPMILIPGGEFVMGDDNHTPDAKPAHKVTLPDFYIDKFEVTNEQYRKFSEETGRPQPTNPWWDNEYFTKFPRSPVLGVSWDEADAYAKWAGKRLPTEQEWEKAASWDPSQRKKRQFPWGDTAERNRANVGGTNRTSDAGRFAGDLSAYGVQDMAGNVAEWVASYYQPYPGNQMSNPDFGNQNYVVRGGTYRGDVSYARTTSRLFHSPQLNESEKQNRAFLIGFRCAVAADDARLQERLRQR